MKKIFRAFIILICILIFGTGAFFISFVLFPLGVFVKDKRGYYTGIIHRSWKFFTCFIQTVKAVKITVIGDITNIRGKIITASHPSLIDIILLIGSIPNSVCIAKQDLLKNPLLKNIVKNVYIINNIDTEKFITDSKQILSQGYNIIIFPTGTRTSAGEEIKIHKGAAQLAVKTNTEIIPIKIECDYPFMCKNKSVFDAGEKTVNYTITVKSPIRPDIFDADSEIKLRNKISDIIKQEIN